MSNILIGLIFLFFDFHIYFGSFAIGLLPDFVGFIFIVKGCVDLSQYSPKFLQCGILAKAAVLYSGACYILDFFGISSSIYVISAILSVIMAVISIIVLYFLVYGIADTEKSRGVDLCGETLKNLWTAYALASACGFLTVALSMNSLTRLLSLATTLLTFVLLYFFYKSRNLFFFTFRR